MNTSWSSLGECDARSEDNDQKHRISTDCTLGIPEITSFMSGYLLINYLDHMTLRCQNPLAINRSEVEQQSGQPEGLPEPNAKPTGAFAWG